MTPPTRDPERKDRAMSEMVEWRTVVDEIAAERQRQRDQGGWTDAHDDEHGNAQMARAAAAYCLNVSADTYSGGAQVLKDAACIAWPWSPGWWKPKNPRRDLIRAAALIVAEIERLDRATLAAAVKEG